MPEILRQVNISRPTPFLYKSKSILFVFSISSENDSYLQQQKYVCLSYLLGRFYYRTKRRSRFTPLLRVRYREHFDFRDHFMKSLSIKIITISFIITQTSVTSIPGVSPRGNRYIVNARNEAILAHHLRDGVCNVSFRTSLYTCKLHLSKILEESLRSPRRVLRALLASAAH